MRPDARFPAVALACLSLAACHSATAPDEPAVLVVEPALVESVTVQVAGSVPVQVLARVQGVVGDGCSTLVRPVRQRRDGARVTLAVQRQRPKGAICTQIARLFDETVRLDGEFAPGTYELKANDVTATFVVE